MADKSISIKVTRNIFANAARLDGDYKTVTETAIRIAAQAKRLAPVDEGRLRNSVMWIAARPDGVSESGAFNTGTGEKASEAEALDRRRLGGGFLRATAWVGTNVTYAPYQEYGTRRMKAQPFMRPAKDIVSNPSDAAAIAKAYEDAAAEAYRQRRVDVRTVIR